MIGSRKVVLGLACLCGAIAILLLPSGCDLFSSGGGTGTLQIFITDAPFPFAFVTEASVTITRIEVRSDSSPDDETADAEDDPDDSDNEDENENSDDDETAEAGEGDSEDGSSAFVTILDEEVSFNLLDLQNGVTASLASGSLTAGSYSQIRLIVSSGHVVLTDGREFELTVPSGEQTGIKLRFDFTITDDETTTLLLDVDVSKAFVPIPGGDVNEASQIEGFQFKPSLALRITELESTGTASGEVADESDAPLAGVAVTAFLGDVEVTTTATAEDGSYVLSGLEPGTYSIAYSLTGFTDETASDVQVIVGADTSIDPVVLVAETL